MRAVKRVVALRLLSILLLGCTAGPGEPAGPAPGAPAPPAAPPQPEPPYGEAAESGRPEDGTEAAAETPAEEEESGAGAGGTCKPAEAAPLDELAWDEWLSRQVARIAECLGTREAWDLPASQLARRVTRRPRTVVSSPGSRCVDRTAPARRRWPLLLAYPVSRDQLPVSEIKWPNLAGFQVDQLPSTVSDCQ